MKLYFEYIAENESTFLRFRRNITLIILVLCVCIGAILFGFKDLSDYSYRKGVVTDIYTNVIHVKPSGSRNLNKLVEKDVVDIFIDYKRYIVRYEIEKHKETILKEIKDGDQLEIYYRLNDGKLELAEIIKDGKSMLDYEGRQKNMVIIYYIIPSLLLIAVFLLIWVIRMRKTYRSKS